LQSAISFIPNPDFSAQFVDGHQSPSPVARPRESLQQALSVFRRPEQVCRLPETGELLGRQQRDIGDDPAAE
jgi:hypothetical protein